MAAYVCTGSAQPHQLACCLPGRRRRRGRKMTTRARMRNNAAPVIVKPRVRRPCPGDRASGDDGVGGGDGRFLSLHEPGSQSAACKRLSKATGVGYVIDDDVTGNPAKSVRGGEVSLIVSLINRIAFIASWCVQHVQPRAPRPEEIIWRQPQPSIPNYTSIPTILYRGPATLSSAPCRMRRSAPADLFD